ncbi:MAG: rhodanese-like domain-containing protein [Candidatus Kapaibacteriales bacterium]
MLKRYYSILTLFIALLWFVSCSDDTTTQPAINEAEEAVKFLESNGDFINTTYPALISATELKTLNEAGRAYIIDIRSAEDFRTGHIKNAHNVALANLLTHVKSINFDNYDKIVIVCYTGQISAFATALLRFYYADQPTIRDKIFGLKWGMCAWHQDFASRWNNAISNKYASQLENTPSPKKPSPGSLPILTTGKKTGKEIVQTRVEYLLNEGFNPASITVDALFQNLNNYFIVNYWPENHYLNIGHIPGAIQYTPKESLKYSKDLLTLPTKTPVVVYCYTGFGSASVSAFLRLLGYDAKSLLFGTNAMIYDKMVENKLTIWKDSEIMNYDYEK